MKYIAEIDSIRAIAVLGVVAFHACPDWVPGGFAGVDVFFVISGFLITAIVQASMQAGDFSLAGFYARRARRILPALVVMLAFTTVIAFAVLMPLNLAKFGSSLMAAAASLANVFFYRGQNYFEPTTNLLPLLHTWSLSVEEQFYAFFPVLLLVLVGCGRSLRMVVLPALLIASLLASFVATPTSPTGSFFLMPTRAWELLLGACLAWGAGLPISHRLIRESTAVVGLVAVIVTYVFLDQSFAWPSGWALLPCLGTVVMIAAVTSGPTIVGRLLAIWPLIGIGRISYSLYLWHWPILVIHSYLRIGLEPAPWEVAGCVLVSLGMGWLSWRWVETPFRGPAPIGAHWSARRVLLGSGVVLALLVAAGLTLRLMHGFPGRLSAEVAVVHSQQVRAAQHRWELFTDQFNPKTWEDLPRRGATGVAPSVLLLGDSHAECLFSALGEEAERHGQAVIGCVQGGTPPLLGVRLHRLYKGPEAHGNNFRAIQGALDQRTIHTVIVAARWIGYLHGADVSGRVSYPDSPPRLSRLDGTTGDDQQLLREGLTNLVRLLRDGGKRVIIIDAIPEMGFNVPLAAMQALRYDRDPMAMGVDVAAFRHRQAPVRQVLGDLPSGTTVVEVMGAFQCGSMIWMGPPSEPWYADDNHLSLAGSRRVVRLCLNALWSDTGGR